MKIVIESLARKTNEANEITIERYQKRRVQRRRRVAKRKLRDVPLFAVEEMQSEFRDIHTMSLFRMLTGSRRNKNHSGDSEKWVSTGLTYKGKFLTLS